MKKYPRNLRGKSRFFYKNEQFIQVLPRTMHLNIKKDFQRSVRGKLFKCKKLSKKIINKWQDRDNTKEENTVKKDKMQMLSWQRTSFKSYNFQWILKRLSDVKITKIVCQRMWRWTVCQRMKWCRDQPKKEKMNILSRNEKKKRPARERGDENSLSKNEKIKSPAKEREDEHFVKECEDEEPSQRKRRWTFCKRMRRWRAQPKKEKMNIL